jgi:peptide/nickel transport system substrate-binding protein
LLNLSSGPLAKPAVRQALLRAMDRELMSRSADPVYTKAAHGSFPDNGWAVDKNVDYLKQYAYDKTAAAQELDQAGYPARNGTRFTLRLRYVPTQPYTQALAAVIAANWRDVGVETKLIQDDTAVWTDAIFKKHHFDATIYSKTTLTDPEYGISATYECNPKNVAFANPTGYCDKNLDTLFAAAARNQDQKARTAVYAEAQQIVAEQLPSLTLLQMDQPDAVRSTFGGIDQFLSGAEHGDLTWSKLTPPS